MRNLHFDQLRSPYFRTGSADEEPPWKPESVPAWRLVDDEDLNHIVSRLPAHLLSVWRLVHDHQLDQTEIASRLGIRRATVASRIFRARAAVRRMLEGSITSARGETTEPGNPPAPTPGAGKDPLLAFPTLSRTADVRSR